MQGLIGDRLIADLIRELFNKESSGLLRVSRGKAIKAIFFDKGLPVFAISNLGSDQLERRLVDKGQATSAQVEQAKQRADKPHRLGAVLVEMGILTDARMRELVREQVMDIILSLFEWMQGEYTLDEKIRASHDVTLDMSVADVLLEGARRASQNPQIAEALAPANGVLVLGKDGGTRVDSGRLAPMESYVLSRIDGPTAVSEVAALSGIGEEDAQRAICALVAAGFLKIVGADKEESDPAARESEEQLRLLREDVARKLHFFSSADYYEILGVTRQATTSDVKAAYYQLAKKFHPDRYRQLEDEELRNKLETVFGMIATAYETLIEPPRRASYDDRLKKSPESVRAAPVRTTPVAHSEPARPVVSDRASVKPPDPAPQPQNSDPLQESESPEFQAAGAAAGFGDHAFHSSPDVPAVDAAPHKSAGPTLNAEQLYQQGRARFDRKEYHAAVHLLREAIKLDPSRAPYHYHLGIALIRNPRTRREAEHHLAKAAELDSYSPGMRIKLGTLYKEMGLMKKAEAFFRDALKLDPENKVAKRELSLLAPGKDAGSLWKSDLGSFAKKIFKK